MNLPIKLPSGIFEIKKTGEVLNKKSELFQENFQIIEMGYV